MTDNRGLASKGETEEVKRGVRWHRYVPKMQYKNVLLKEEGKRGT